VNPGLHSFGDAVWLAFTTLTTIGYGDVHPVTTDGRIVSAILVITGTGFFALLSGEFATLLIKAYKNQSNEANSK
jgi:voltage-gated potassium channel